MNATEIKTLKEITQKTVIKSANSTAKKTIYKVCDVSYNQEKILRPLVEALGFKTYGENYAFCAYK